jgi:hypothetical protein
VHGIVKSLQAHGWWSRSRTASATCSARPCSSSPTSTSTPSTSEPARCAGPATSPSAPAWLSGWAWSSSPRSSSSTTSPVPTAAGRCPRPAHHPRPRVGAGQGTPAYQPEFRQALLAKGPLRSLTAETVTDPDELDKDLAEVLATGYAVEDEEAVLGSTPSPSRSPTATARRWPRSPSSCPPRPTRPPARADPAPRDRRNVSASSAPHLAAARGPHRRTLRVPDQTLTRSRLRVDGME